MADGDGSGAKDATTTMTERERALLDIVGRAVLATNECSAAMLGMLAFVLDNEESGKVLSGDDVTRMLAEAAKARVGTESVDTPVESPKTFGRKRRARDASTQEEQPK